jgi:NADPH-dependent ferric siderophore reductase
LLEACPPHIRVTVFAEIGSASERRNVAGLAIDDVHWVVRDGSQRSLARALEAYEWQHGNGRLYVGCEAGMVREIRRHALETLGFDRSHVTTRGYWALGTSIIPITITPSEFQQRPPMTATHGEPRTVP